MRGWAINPPAKIQSRAEPSGANVNLTSPKDAPGTRGNAADAANWVVIVAAFGYIGLLFAIASYGDRVSGQPRGRAGVLIYPLSLAIYCTSWTFFGSVGLATRTGIEFLAIYAGPILMVGFGTPLLMRVVRLAKTHNITSIADFIAARYGKSQAVAATVAIIALIGSIPYIALQLKAVASSLETVSWAPPARCSR